MNNIDTNEVEPLLRSSAKDEKRETSRTVKLAALAGCGILAGAAVLGTGHSRDSFRLFGGQPAVRLGAQTGESAGQLIDGVNEEHLWVKEKSVIIPGTCNSPADVKLVGFQPKGKNRLGTHARTRDINAVREGIDGDKKVVHCGVPRKQLLAR